MSRSGLGFRVYGLRASTWDDARCLPSTMWGSHPGLSLINSLHSGPRTMSRSLEREPQQDLYKDDYCFEYWGAKVVCEMVSTSGTSSNISRLTGSNPQPPNDNHQYTYTYT